MTEEVQLTLREARPQDAQALLEMLQQTKKETDYILVDKAALQLSLDALATELQAINNSMSDLLFLAVLDQQIIGVVSVEATADKPSSLVGEIGISILKKYWGMGLGTLLFEEVILWTKVNDVLSALVLEVQERNQRAIHLYHKVGFQIVATNPYGAKSNAGEFLSTIKMKMEL
ncbi:hypothetical protein A5844_001798 [Enterococcus sp. 10A9_DIV0425]|uniref:N-acetyltransferase domain-containing protein n=1 Tax=Candidatus Enterococcus wittei TaxID=1987383 RepID=A0A242JY07_9ENTE|nr:GNAT family N-acetyltransferase [Enterococcus sp. 10A9_DIV0425]OTP10100.1 hypothetical protein A5844_001798 [Enterococcus sp. 10A9_DIV0425]